MARAMKSRRLVFAGAGQIVIEQQPTGIPRGEQLLVQTQLSGISAGTELLIYRGEAPPDMQADGNLPALRDPGWGAVGSDLLVWGEIVWPAQ